MRSGVSKQPGPKRDLRNGGRLLIFCDSAMLLFATAADGLSENLKLH